MPLFPKTSKEYKSPIAIHFYRNGPKKNRIEIEHNESGEILAQCMVGDDIMTERIADILSAKRLPREAQAFRQLVRDARRGR